MVEDSESHRIMQKLLKPLEPVEEEMIENAKQVLTSMGEKLTKSEARRFGVFSYKMKYYV